MIRIATAGFQHESNTFSTVPASLDRWRASGILEGDAIRAEYESSQSTLAASSRPRRRTRRSSWCRWSSPD